MVDWDAVVLGPVVGVFGEPVTYVPAAGQPITVSGVFDEAYTEVIVGGDGIPVTSVMPVLGVRIAQFPQLPRQGDTLTVQRTGERFTVREVRDDGHGCAKLMLNFLG